MNRTDFHISLGLNPSTEAIRYDQMFRKRGARTYEYFVNPRFSDLETFELPLDAVVHYIPESAAELGIAPNHLFLRKAPSYILSHEVEALKTREGDPIDVPVQVKQLQMRYRQQYRRIRPLRNYLSAGKDQRTIIVENYALLEQLVRYRKTIQTRWFKFVNLWNTVVDNINNVAKELNRKQWLQIRLPKHMPTLRAFMLGSRGMNHKALQVFRDDDMLVLLEIFKWLGAGPDRGVLKALSPKAIEQLQFVWIVNGKYTLLSAKQLMGWRKQTPEEIEAEGEIPSEESKQVTPKQLQLQFTRFLESVYECRSVVAGSEIETVIDEETGEEKVVTITDDGEQIELSKDDAQLQKEADQYEKDRAVQDELDESGTDDGSDDLDGLSIDGDDDDSEDVLTQYISTDNSTDLAEPPADDNGYGAGVVKKAEDLLEQGLITAAELRRFRALAEKYKTIPSPYGKGTLEDAAHVPLEITSTLEEVKFKDVGTVLDKSMEKSTLKAYDATYIEKVMKADVTNAVLHLQNAGLAVTDYRIEQVEDAHNEMDVHIVRITPVGGSPSVVRFTVPRLDKDGVWTSRGVKYRMRKQRADVPIRKTKFNEVGLTSYVSKLFVKRSDKKVDDYGNWLRRSVQLLIEDKQIDRVKYLNVFDNETPVPAAYSALACNFSMFRKGEFEFNFDVKNVRELYGEKEIGKLLKTGEVPCGKVKGQWIVMNDSGAVYCIATNKQYGFIEDILGIDLQKAPVEKITISLMGKALPIGIALGYYFGLSNLLRKLNVEHRSVVRGSRMDLQSDEFAIPFADESLIISRQHRLAALIIGSYNIFKKSIGRYNRMDFDSKDVYGAVLDQEGLGVRYTRELDLMENIWVDKITEEILIEMQEPTTFSGLLFRSCELLVHDTHPRENDGRYRRIRGNERIVGHVYAELARSMRQFNSKPLTAKAKFDMKPNEIWNNLHQDPSVGIVNEINPIENLKEQELLTFAGTGGRSSRTMVKRSREFDRSDMGLISEATVDNQNTGVTAYMPPNPKIKNLRGMPADYKFDESDVSSFLSTSSLLCPGSTKDDAKRANFINIQMSHVLPCKGYEALPLRTGYETVIAQRVGPMFAFAVDSPGVLQEVNKNTIVIKYDDPDRPNDVVEVGRLYGKSAGHVYPQDMICDVPAGTKLKPGHVVAYNTGFFERDIFDPTQVVMRMGVMMMTAIMDTCDTLEDSCAISREAAKKLFVEETHTRVVTLRFDQAIHNLVSVGEHVTIDSILCSIEDAVTANTSLFDEDDKDTLRRLARNSPKAEVRGTVGKIDVVYHGEIEDMHESLASIVQRADSERAKIAKKKGSNILSGHVGDIDMDTVEITIHIDHHLGMGDGDKVVFCNQLKSTVRRIMEGTNTTESGIPIDAFFGKESIDNRIVCSPDDYGTTSVLLQLSGKRACAAYRKAKK